MNWKERQKMIAKETLKLEKVEESKITKTEEIEGLRQMISCMREFEDKTEEELQKIYDKGLNEIENKYSTE